MRRYLTDNNDIRPFPLIRDLTLIFVLFITIVMAGCPIYGVWEQGLVGKAALARATQDRQIKIEEAQAIEQSSVSLAEAERIRAQGVADANRIIADGLGGPEGYLRYLWIQTLDNQGNKVVYVPTEANIPIMEASRTILEK
jgi:hypothetical protein